MCVIFLISKSSKKACVDYYRDYLNAAFDVMSSLDVLEAGYIGFDTYVIDQINYILDYHHNSVEMFSSI